MVLFRGSSFTTALFLGFVCSAIGFIGARVLSPNNLFVAQASTIIGCICAGTMILDGWRKRGDDDRPRRTQLLELGSMFIGVTLPAAIILASTFLL